MGYPRKVGQLSDTLKSVWQLANKLSNFTWVAKKCKHFLFEWINYMNDCWFWLTEQTDQNIFFALLKNILVSPLCHLERVKIISVTDWLKRKCLTLCWLSVACVVCFAIFRFAQNRKAKPRKPPPPAHIR